MDRNPGVVFHFGLTPTTSISDAGLRGITDPFVGESGEPGPASRLQKSSGAAVDRFHRRPPAIGQHHRVDLVQQALPVLEGLGEVALGQPGFLTDRLDRRVRIPPVPNSSIPASISRSRRPARRSSIVCPRCGCLRPVRPSARVLSSTSSPCLVAELGQGCFTGADDRIGEFTLGLVNRGDAVFNRALGDQAVDPTELSWPIRWARSVACSSTAGFHQRS